MSISSSKNIFNFNYIKKLIIIIFLFILFLMLGNLLNDPNSIFHDHKNGITWREPNQNFLKIKHLLTEPAKKIILFGSSRIQTIPVSNLEKLNPTLFKELNIQPQEIYNMGTYGRTLWNTWHDLQILEKNNKLPKTILLGLDEATYVSNDNDRQQLKVSVAYPINFLEWINFIKVYLLTKNQSSYEFLERLFYPKINVAHYFDIDKSGEIFYQQLETTINNNPEHWKTNEIFNINYIQRTGAASSENLEYLQNIVQLCKSNHIQLKVFFNPVYKKFFLQADFEKLFEFKKNVSEIIEFYDFQANDLTAADKTYWYDQDHYRPNLGLIILDEVFKKRNLLNLENPNDLLYFKYVNKKNINDHLESQKKYFNNNSN